MNDTSSSSGNGAIKGDGDDKFDNRGRFYVFEGPDGAGKSSLVERLLERLKVQQRDCVALSFPGRDEGTLGSLVYKLHHKPECLGITSVNPMSLQLLHIAAHVDAIEGVILPHLCSGRTVILDRFWWSTWVYGKASGVSETALNNMIGVELERWGNTLPDTLFMVTGQGSRRSGESRGAWDKHLALYRELASREAERYPVVEVSNQGTIEESLAQILHHISKGLD